MVFSLLFTPIGRYAAITVAALVILFGIYVKIQDDAVAQIEASATMDRLRRTENALRASDSLKLTPDRLREPDSNERD